MKKIWMLDQKAMPSLQITQENSFVLDNKENMTNKNLIEIIEEDLKFDSRGEISKMP